MKEKLRNPFVQQYLMEIVLPLVGYFFFEWDVLIIGIYYFLDYLSGQILFYRRAYWVMSKNVPKGKFYLFLISIGIFIALIIAEFLSFGYTLMHHFKWNDTVLMDRMIAFAKEELWLLFPVLLFVNHIQDQFTFYAPRRYLKRKFSKYILSDTLKALIAFSLFMGGIFLWYRFTPHPLIVILSFIIVKVIFDLSLKKRMDKISFI